MCTIMYNNNIIMIIYEIKLGNFNEKVQFYIFII